MADDPITTIYLADRADGSAIYQAHMNLLYVITTYAVLVAAAIGTNFVNDPWALAFIGVPLWGLLCYQTQLLVLVSVRVNSIKILEHKLLEDAQLDGRQKNQLGSDAGDRISRLSKQPTGLRTANYASFLAIGVASIVVAITALTLVEPKCSVAFVLGVVTHSVLAIILSFTLHSLSRIEHLIADLGDEGPYYSLKQHPTLPPPGWYADPTGASKMRYWDGSQWDLTVESPAQGNKHSDPSGQGL